MSEIYEGTWLEVEYRRKNSNPTHNWDFAGKYPLPLKADAIASLKNFQEDFEARVVEVFQRRTPIAQPEVPA